MLDERQASARQSRGSKQPEQAANRLGLVVSELTAEQRRELKMSSGLLIEEIRGTSGRADLRPGDIVIAVISKGATTDVKTVDQFNKLLAQFEKGSSVTLLIRRGDMQTFVTIKGLNSGN
jgi:serine protease Do